MDTFLNKRGGLASTLRADCAPPRRRLYPGSADECQRALSESLLDLRPFLGPDALFVPGVEFDAQHLGISELVEKQGRVEVLTLAVALVGYMLRVLFPVLASQPIALWTRLPAGERNADLHPLCSRRPRHCQGDRNNLVLRVDFFAAGLLGQHSPNMTADLFRC